VELDRLASSGSRPTDFGQELTIASSISVFPEMTNYLAADKFAAELLN
jgi:hypothetical protein